MKSLTGTLTLRSVADNNIQVTFAIDGRDAHSLDFYIDQTGALQPVVTPEAMAPRTRKTKDADLVRDRAVAEALALRLSLASRVATRTETSFPIVLSVPWANGPINPILSIRSASDDSFVGDAYATAFVNPPKSRHKFGLLVPFGLGVAGAFATGVTGGLIAAAGPVASTWAGNHSSNPLPVDVSLHLVGDFSRGRLRSISGDQEDLVHSGKHTSKSTEQWSIVAG